jgi:hypothetical protein
MKHVLKYLEEVMLIKPLGEVTTDPYESECGSYTGETIFINNKDVGIIVYYIDYINWLEKKFRYDGE